MTKQSRLFDCCYLAEAVVFFAAALVHTGVLIDGYQNREAAIAESLLAGALYVGLGLSWLRPYQTRKAGIVAQACALYGTLIGIVMIIAEVGPQTISNILYHLGMVGLLLWGLYYTIRTPTGLSEEAERPGTRRVA